MATTTYTPWPTPYAGRVDEHVIESELLRGNPLGDAPSRPLLVQLPPGYDESADEGRRYPVVYLLQGYTGAVPMWRNRSPYRQPFMDAVDALLASGSVPQVIVVYVDAWTRYGGSQFVDSTGTGRYHSYLCDEVVPFVDARYRTLASPSHRGVQGKSSGGFGAMITPMLRPDLFGALATHAGDTLYELCYLPELGKVVRLLRQHGGDIWRWWADFAERVERGLAFTVAGDDVLVMTLGCSAAFSPGADGTPELPLDPVTGRLRPEHWERWLAWDPVRMVADHADAMRGMRTIWIDAGTRDEWYLDVGATAFRAALDEVGVAPDRVRHELFDATHMGIDYRYPQSLAHLARVLGTDPDGAPVGGAG